MEKQKSALLLIDAQVNMFSQENAVFESAALLKKLKVILTAARNSKVEVIFIQNNGSELDPDQHGTVGWYIHPELAPRSDEKIVQKYELDAFAKSDLLEYLQTKNISKVVIAGLQSEYCIATNCRTAKRLGLEVILVKDAHSTYDSFSEMADDLIDEVNAEMDSAIETTTTETILKEWHT